MALFGPRQPPRTRPSSAGFGKCVELSRRNGGPDRRCRSSASIAVEQRLRRSVGSRTGCSAEEKGDKAAGHRAALALEKASLRLQDRIAVLLGPRHPQLCQLRLLLNGQQLLQAYCDHLPLIRSCFASWLKFAARGAQGAVRGTSCELTAPASLSPVTSVTLMRCLYRWREAWLLMRDRRVSLHEEERRTRRLMSKEAIVRKRIGLLLGDGRGCNDMSSLAWASLHLWVRGVAAQRLAVARSELATSDNRLAGAYSESRMWQQRAEASLASSLRVRSWRQQAAGNVCQRLFKARAKNNLRHNFSAWRCATLKIRQRRQQHASFWFEVGASSGCANAALLSRCLRAWGTSFESTECTISTLEEERTLLEAHLASSQRCLRVLEAWARGLEDSLLRVCFRAWGSQLASTRAKRAGGMRQTFSAWARHISVSRKTYRLKACTSWLLFRRREASRFMVLLAAWQAETQLARRDRALAGSGRRGAARRCRHQLAWAENCRGRCLKRLVWACWKWFGQMTRNCVHKEWDRPMDHVTRSRDGVVPGLEADGKRFLEQNAVKGILQQRTARPLLTGLRPGIA